MLLFGCAAEVPPADTLFVLRSPRATGLEFINAIQEDDSSFNLVDYYYVYNGAGVAVGDVNGDSLPDVYFTGNMVSSRLYLNRGSLHFEDVTDEAAVATQGWSTGATFADVDGDGDLDLYVSRAGPHPAAGRTNLLFINEGADNATDAPRFSERAASFGLADTSHSTQAAFFDYDKDGDLDVFLLNHSNEPTPNRIRPLLTDGSAPDTDRLYRNDGDAGFTNVSTAAGIRYPGLSLGLTVSDLDGDGWEDVYVANDFMASDYVYLNNRDGTFSERGAELFKHYSYAAMGADIADINNDGWVDVAVVDMRPPDNEQQKRMAYPMNYDFFQWSLSEGYHPQYWRNTLQVSNGLNAAGRLTFSDVGQFAGVDATDWSWSPLFADFDNDGLLDLWITNGYRRAVIDMDFIGSFAKLQFRDGLEGSSQATREMARQMYDLARTDQVFRNKTPAGAAQAVSFDHVSDEWGITEAGFSNGAAYADFDRDGDLDMIVSRIDDAPAFFENRSVGTRSLIIYLRGAGLNTFGLGADVRIFCGGRMQHRHQSVTRGYQSSMDYAMHFGLGSCTSVDSLRVDWPDGSTQRLASIATNQALTLDQADAAPAQRMPRTPPTGLLAEAGASMGLSHRHREEAYDDFDRQRLLPHQHSRSGPGVAVGDVNGDGREDMYVGGAFRQPGRLFIQQHDGAFAGTAIVSEGKHFEEDTGALFFDADGDGDLDLYVASGSNEFQNRSPYLQDRLYLNDGRANFSLAADALPDLRTSTSCVRSADYDADGDLDLFVCGRLRPLAYPMPGRSYLLRNDGGTFADVTDEIAPQLREAGMVTDALWTDFDDDGRFDLMVVGEFMPIRFFRSGNNGFTDASTDTGLGPSVGWWNSIAAGDFDRDGDTDYVVGNLGLNSRFTASVDEPISVYARSFDFNGDIDPILTQFLQGEEVPVVSYDDFMGQLPGMKLAYPTYEMYATATIRQIFEPRQLEQALTYRATRFENSYIENLGSGLFRMDALPAAAQLSPLHGLVVDDVDGDGSLDLLAVGNFYGPEVITGRHDALVGLYLRGDGRGGFDAIPHAESGFFVDGDARGLAILRGKDGDPLYVATQNNDLLRTFVPARSASARGASQQVVSPRPLDVAADITYEDGATQRLELYYGSGYLSQSSRRFLVPGDAAKVTLYGSDGSMREIPAGAPTNLASAKP